MRPENVGQETLLPARPRRGSRDDFARLVDDRRGDAIRADACTDAVVGAAAPPSRSGAPLLVSDALRDLVRQILGRVDAARSHVIVLFSPAFGRIRLVVTRKAGRVALHLQFHRAEATDSLDHHAQTLRALLGAAGLTCELEVTGLGPDPGED